MQNEWNKNQDTSRQAAEQVDLHRPYRDLSQIVNVELEARD